MELKKFLLNDKGIEKSSFLWNMMGNILMAFQSVIMLIILTHMKNLYEAGVFTIANVSSNLFLTIGKYGGRYFQVSDVYDQFSFAEYRTTRIVTSVIMVLISAVYVICADISKGYSAEKVFVILWMCLFKAIDALEDVYHGHYQKMNRLDVAARSVTLRLIITNVFFGVTFIILENLLLTLISSTILSAFLFFFFTKQTYGEFHVPASKVKKEKIILLLKVNFPLFMGNFLSFYICNAPKYAIDSTLNDELQACYGFISMPVFIISLLNGFIFNPVVYKMSILWNRKEIKKFVKRILIQIAIIVLITSACLFGATMFGIPILSFLYNTNLSSYKTELLLLLLGGGLLGISGLLSTVITIMRFHNKMVWGYVLAAALACICSNSIVQYYGVMGAAMLYTILMGFLCIVFLFIFVGGILKNKRIK